MVLICRSELFEILTESIGLDGASTVCLEGCNRCV